MLTPLTGPDHPVKSSEEKIPPKPQFTRKENATLAQKIEILDWYHVNGKSQQKTAEHFDTIYPNLWLKQPKMSEWCRDESRFRAEYERGSGADCSAKRIHQMQHPEVTEMLDLWVSKVMAHVIILTGEILHQKWRVFAD